MKLANKIVCPLLVVITGVITSGCSGTGTATTYLPRRNAQSPRQGRVPLPVSVLRILACGTERGGAAIRYPGYEHYARESVCHQ